MSYENIGQQFEGIEDRPVYSRHVTALKSALGQIIPGIIEAKGGLDASGRLHVNRTLATIHESLDESLAAHAKGDFAFARGTFAEAYHHIANLHEDVERHVGATSKEERNAGPSADSMKIANAITTHLQHNLYRNMPRDYGDSVY